jgi:CRISPR-associated protein Csc1
MTTIYRCQLTLLEPTFFSSREISNYYQTEPLIGNYALAYALGLVRTPWFNDGTIHYVEHLGGLNEQGIYVTPATIEGSPRFTLAQFNAQPDSYWYAMGNNVIVTRPDGKIAAKNGSKWYIKSSAKETGSGVNLENRPQHGRIRFLSIGNKATFYIITADDYTPPSYIRLGKFMSKAKVETTKISFVESEKQNAHIKFLLNPADLGPDTSLLSFSLINVPPVPLVQHSLLSGIFFELADKQFLPKGMRFGV